MSETVTVTIAGTPTPIVFYDSNTLEAARQSGLASASAAAAALSEALAESLNGPTYASTAAGLAATASGDYFAVDAGGGLVSIYLDNAGSAVLQRTLATSSALAAGSGTTLLGFLSSGVSAVSRTLFAWLMDRPINPKNFGCTFHAVEGDVVDSGAAWRKTLAASALLGLEIELPAGFMLVTDADVNATGIGFIPPANCTIRGQGENTTLIFKRTIFSSFFGFSIQNSNITLADMTVKLNKNGGSWCAVACDTGPHSGLTFRDVTIKGTTARAGHYGYRVNGHDFDRFEYDGVHGELLDFAFVKSNGDFSTQSRLKFRCTVADSTEGLELNSPGETNGTFTSGSPVITGIATTVGMAAGQKIKGPAIPLGATIQSVDGGTQITLSANATATGAKRFSIGTIEGVKVDIYADTIGQWAVGVANCKNVDIDAYVTNCQYSAAHIEDHSENIRVKLGGHSCNISPGQVGSPGADNAAVLVITGAKDVVVDFAGFDLRRNTTGTPNALYVQNGVAGTTNTDDKCVNIEVKGKVLAKSGTLGVVAYNTDIKYDLEVESLSTSRASPVLKMYSCRWSGRLKSVEPGVILSLDNGARGVFDRLELETTGTAFTGLTAWDSGVFANARNHPPVANEIVFRLNSVADTGGTWKTLCPVPVHFKGPFEHKFVGASHNYEFGEMEIKASVLVPRDITEVDAGVVQFAVTSTAQVVTTGDTTNNSPTLTNLASLAGVEVGCPVSGTGIPAGSKVISLESVNSVKLDKRATATAAGITITLTPPKQTDDTWRVSGSNLQFREYAGSNDTGESYVRFDGAFWPVA